jgi:hypothetical protein
MQMQHDWVARDGRRSSVVVQRGCPAESKIGRIEGGLGGRAQPRSVACADRAGFAQAASRRDIPQNDTEEVGSMLLVILRNRMVDRHQTLVIACCMTSKFTRQVIDPVWNRTKGAEADFYEACLRNLGR